MTLTSAALARLFITATSTGLILTGLFCAAVINIDLRALNASQLTTEQHTWQNANVRCEKLGANWQLPSFVELTAIYYRSKDYKLLDHTDYWSRNTLLGFALGLNTGRSIASFDRHQDTDHFLCVKTN